MATSFDRRQLLCGGCAAFTLAACGRDPGAPAPGATGDTGDTSRPGTTDPTPASTYPCDQALTPGGPGWTPLPLVEYPDLAEVGGWYPVTVAAEEIVVAHVIDGCYTAIRRACAHEGVAIDYVPARGQFVCPRHGAIYDLQGDKVAGPQPTGLPVYPVGRQGDTIWVLVGP